VTDYLVNPRRAPRAPSRCRASVRIPGAAWVTETEDIGPHGCQLVAPNALPRGMAIHLEVSTATVGAPLEVAGKIAWVSSRPPWRLGVAFAEGLLPASTRWYEALVAASPGLASIRRVPDRLPVDAMVFLGPPPRLLVDFMPEEVEVLRHVAGGISVGELRDRLRTTWGVSMRALFGLMARGVVTLSRGSAVHPEAWRQVMAQLGAEFVVAAPPAGAAHGARRLEPSPRAEQATMRAVELGVTPDRERPAAQPRPPTLVEQPHAGQLPVAPPPPSVEPPPPDGSFPEATAGTGWRGTGRTRSREAQEAFDLGRQELSAGRISSALAHLRRALQLAPGDPDVAAEVGRAMRGGG